MSIKPVAGKTNSAPSARVRNRVRPQPAPAVAVAEVRELVAPGGEIIDEAPGSEIEAGDNSIAIETEAKAKVLEALRLNKAANEASALARAAAKEAGIFFAAHELGTALIEFDGKLYDCGHIAETVEEVSVEKLKDVLGNEEEFLKLVKSSQTAVKDHGGKTLLDKVLVPVTKPSEFKMKKRTK